MKPLDLKDKLLPEKINKIVQSETNNTVVSNKYIGGGSNGKAFKLTLEDGRIIVIKAYRAAGMNESEAHQLKILAENTNVTMPEVLFTYSDDTVGLLAMTFIPGSNVLNPVFLLKKTMLRRKFADEVTNGILCWHSKKGSRFGNLDNPEFSSWYDYYRNNKANTILSGIKSLADNGKFNKKRYEVLLAATEAFDKVYEEPKNSVLIHGDLNIMNIMADRRTFKLNGFIDPFDSIWADREYDLFQLRNMWGDKFYLYETYKNKCKDFSKYSDFRVAYYGTMNEVSCRLNGSMIFKPYEDLWFKRLKTEMVKLFD